MGYARRQAVRYTLEEDRDLLAQVATGYRLQDIAEYHERTVGGISLQIERLRMASKENFDRQLTALWASNFRNGWLSRGRLKVYVRAGHHVIDGAITKCLDIANVVALPQGKGQFTDFINWIESDFIPRTGGVIYVENVLNERLRGFLLRRGYTKTDKWQHYYLKVDKRETG